jgi:hypothetical protein
MVADLYSAEEDTLSGGLRSDLRTILVEEYRLPYWLSDRKRCDLQAIPAPLPRAWVGRECARHSRTKQGFTTGLISADRIVAWQS